MTGVAVPPPSLHVKKGPGPAISRGHMGGDATLIADFEW